MEFDKTKVYTAVNADELKAGDLVIAALTLDELERNVELEMDIQTLEHISDSSCLDRFGLNLYDDADNLRYYPLVYLIEPPQQAKKQKEPQYKPFSSVEKAMEVINKHGGWVKSDSNLCFFVAGYDMSYDANNNETAVFFCERWHSMECLNDEFVFADDGTPCGELVEE